MLAATNERARLVRPEHCGPAISVIAPTGRPPPNSSSTAAMPVGQTGRTVLGCGVSAEGILAARADSISRRMEEAVGIERIRHIFAYYLPVCKHTAFQVWQTSA